MVDSQINHGCRRLNGCWVSVAAAMGKNPAVEATADLKLRIPI